MRVVGGKRRRRDSAIRSTSGVRVKTLSERFDHRSVAERRQLRLLHQIGRDLLGRTDPRRLPTVMRYSSSGWGSGDRDPRRCCCTVGLHRSLRIGADASVDHA